MITQYINIEFTFGNKNLKRMISAMVLLLAIKIKTKNGKRKIGRPPISIDKKRIQIRPTVKRSNKIWLENHEKSSGRIIDELIETHRKNQENNK